MVEGPFAYPELTARENVYYSARLHGLDRRAAQAATTDALTALGLTGYAVRRAGRLSTGNRQRVGLAAALVHAPTVIMLDEPTGALDPRGVLVLRELLRSAARDRNAAVLVSSHHLDEVSRMADTVTVLHGGRIVGTLSPGTADLERQFFALVLAADEDADGASRGAPAGSAPVAVAPVAVAPTHGTPTPDASDKGTRAPGPAMTTRQGLFAGARDFEALKFRRALTVRAVSALLCLALPALAAVLTVAATNGADTPLAAKASVLLVGTGWSGYLGAVAMMLSVANPLGVGFVVSWCFGREFADASFGGLFALPVGRRQIAYAKFAVVLGWSAIACLGVLLGALAAGLCIGLGIPDPVSAGAIGGRALVGGLLAALLALPLAFVASAGRGPLAGVGALILLIVATQVITALGVGAWFPWAAPGLWLGLGGADAASDVTVLQLFLAVPVAALGVIATGEWWHRARVR
ncbi:ABC transporter ATP-binding protein [Cryobacterium breve]|uniref:ABC transporter ATP-binding protein n=1 Tax=Cryobacterium breve TaxID=1259258 RepID=A0ABY7NE01_9MICO|nr:ABC transporter permease [Cryobacterium breve]WBM79778.1 ABC transporter ATP-binding protein [Cryobacterium breve]